MGDPACFLSQVYLECGRFVDDAPEEAICPHCGDIRRLERRDVVLPRSANFIMYRRSWSDTVAFYRDRLGLTETFRNEWFVEFGLGPDAHVSIADAARASVGAVGGTGVTLSLEVSDLEYVRAGLAGRGVDPGPLSKRFDALVFDVHGPEGNRIEFWSAPAPGQRGDRSVCHGAAALVRQPQQG